MKPLDGGRILARQLKALGVDTVFTVVAGPMTGVLSSLHDEGVRIIGCRHEENAGFMAMAWGYLNRRAGVVIVGSGPGMSNALTPMYVATASGMPLVVIGGSIASGERGLGGFQEADQLALARPACKWAEGVGGASRMADLVHLALGKAASGRPGAVYLDVPADVIREKLDAGQGRLRQSVPRIALAAPGRQAIDELATFLQGAEKPLIVIGKGAAWADAGSELQELVELGFPYVCSPMARGVIPDDHPNFMNAARSLALREADRILVMGARLNWMFGLGRAPILRDDVRIAQVDVVAEELFSAAEVELGVVADVKLAARELVNALRGKANAGSYSSWIDALDHERRHKLEKSEVQVDAGSELISPWDLVRAVRKHTPRESIVVADGEVIMGVARTMMPSFHARRVLNGGTTGCIGVGIPYAIGAKLARPDLPCVAILGDYAFGAAMMDIETAVRMGVDVKFIIANNAGICGSSLQDYLFPADAPPIARLLPARYDKTGEMVGMHSEHVQGIDALDGALQRAMAAPGPAVVNVQVDPQARHGVGAYFQLRE